MPRPWEGLLGVNYGRKNLKLDKPLKVGGEKWVKVRVSRKGENLCPLSTQACGFQDRTFALFTPGCKSLKDGTEEEAGDGGDNRLGVLVREPGN